MNLAEEFYKNNIQKNSKKSNAVRTKVNVVGWSRLAVLILGGLIDYFLYRENKMGTIIIVTIIFIGIFLPLSKYFL